MMCPNFIYWILQVLKALKPSKSLEIQGLLARFFDSTCNTTTCYKYLLFSSNEKQKYFKVFIEIQVALPIMIDSSFS